MKFFFFCKIFFISNVYTSYIKKIPFVRGLVNSKCVSKKPIIFDFLLCNISDAKVNEKLLTYFSDYNKQIKKYVKLALEISDQNAQEVIDLLRIYFSDTKNLYKNNALLFWVLFYFLDFSINEYLKSSEDKKDDCLSELLEVLGKELRMFEKMVAIDLKFSSSIQEQSDNIEGNNNKIYEYLSFMFASNAKEALENPVIRNKNFLLLKKDILAFIRFASDSLNEESTISSDDKKEIENPEILQDEPFASSTTVSSAEMLEYDSIQGEKSNERFILKDHILSNEERKKYKKILNNNPLDLENLKKIDFVLEQLKLCLLKEKEMPKIKMIGASIHLQLFIEDNFLKESLIHFIALLYNVDTDTAKAIFDFFSQYFFQTHRHSKNNIRAVCIYYALLTYSKQAMLSWKDSTKRMIIFLYDGFSSILEREEELLQTYFEKEEFKDSFKGYIDNLENHNYRLMLAFKNLFDKKKINEEDVFAILEDSINTEIVGEKLMRPPSNKEQRGLLYLQDLNFWSNNLLLTIFHWTVIK
jgi:hypothetical protein